MNRRARVHAAASASRVARRPVSSGFISSPGPCFYAGMMPISSQCLTHVKPPAQRIPMYRWVANFRLRKPVVTSSLSNLRPRCRDAGLIVDCLHVPSLLVCSFPAPHLREQQVKRQPNKPQTNGSALQGLQLCHGTQSRYRGQSKRTQRRCCRRESIHGAKALSSQRRITPFVLSSSC